eukprot:364860-Chlamydomonas_euryale.AAC.3
MQEDEASGSNTPPPHLVQAKTFGVKTLAQARASGGQILGLSQDLAMALNWGGVGWRGREGGGRERRGGRADCGGWMRGLVDGWAGQRSCFPTAANLRRFVEVPRSLASCLDGAPAPATALPSSTVSPSSFRRPLLPQRLVLNSSFSCPAFSNITP